jgi:ATP phosphoribosyltransferase
MESFSKPELTIALPKGRLLKEVLPILERAGLQPEEEFFDSTSRRLQFGSNHPNVGLVPVKPFDVATFVAFGGADIGLVGADVIHEFSYDEIYVPVDLDIGHCRLSVAATPEIAASSMDQLSHLRIATKYPGLTRRFFAGKGIQAECVKLNGAIELAPKLGLCPYIVDIVTTGNTLRANGLVELETIIESTSRLAVNRNSFKTRTNLINYWISAFRDAVAGQQTAA